MDELEKILVEFEEKSRETCGINPFFDGPTHNATQLMLAEIILNQRKIINNLLP